MKIQRRKFSQTEKIRILDNAERFGVTYVLREHQLSYSVFVQWKHKYRPGANTSRAAVKGNMAAEIKRLSEENDRMNRIIAAQALEIQRKDHELKKYKITQS